ncbi:MAG: DNA-binding MarR family transcriptional regulator [Flavobacteriaceae bacterium]|jgi:DNA-binding MarR family transcriptional regulator/N-acetylglutamate synthase-like GNAT family acetyltransferase|uniref:bifunctional helix-turn-helix transcriptional regulator/GNAT family N-acetyltransferase n=1 Tax=Candidatus Marifrigoribacter sp. Uisw_064 TaxID=3230970 RepID=UPI003AEC170E
MDILHTLGEIGLGSRLKRISDLLMKITQQIYTKQHIDFDPYLFPAFNTIAKLKKTTNTEIRELLHITQPAVTQNINKLLQKELIELQHDDIDKRKKWITLSSKGEKAVNQLQPLWNILDRTVKQYTVFPAGSLIEHLNYFEENLKNGNYMKTIQEKVNTELAIRIIPFDKQYATHFYELNVDWLEKYFYVENYDREVLSKPQQYIIKPGGHIFFAVQNNEILGTVALLKNDEGIYELTKMAVSPKHQGKKVGQLIMQYCIDFAKENKYKKLFLYSHTILANAIYIYRKYGFIEIEVEADSPYERSDIKMELLITPTTV